MSEIELDEMDRKRYEEIFKKLDTDANGKIDIHDLRDALGMSEKVAQVSLELIFV
jgi:Ca2+-binding EF-hand superfamily protein